MEPHGLGQGFLSKGKQGFCGCVDPLRQLIMVMGITGAPEVKSTTAVSNLSNTHWLPIFCAPLLSTRGLGDTGKLDVITLDVLGQELGPIGPVQEVRQTFPEEVDGLEGTREEGRGHLGFHPHALHYMVRLKERGSSSVTTSPPREW